MKLWNYIFKSSNVNLKFGIQTSNLISKFQSNFEQTLNSRFKVWIKLQTNLEWDIGILYQDLCFLIQKKTSHQWKRSHWSIPELLMSKKNSKNLTYYLCFIIFKKNQWLSLSPSPASSSRFPLQLPKIDVQSWGQTPSLPIPWRKAKKKMFKIVKSTSLLFQGVCFLLRFGLLIQK